MVNFRKILSFFKNKKVFITGHTGFKGAWLAYMLDQAGAITNGYSLAPETKPNLFENLKLSKRFNSITGDIRDYNSLNKCLKDFEPEFVFHLAAQPLVLESYEFPFKTHSTNYNGTLNLLESLRSLNIYPTSLFITTDKVYKNIEDGRLFSEDDSLGGIDPYSASKSASEILISSYYNSFFTKHCGISSVRAGNVIGGGDWSKFRLIPDIIRANYNNIKLQIRNLEAVRPWQHVLEALFGYLLLAYNLDKRPQEFSQSWNFGPSKINIKTVSDILDQANKKNINPQLNLLNDPYKETKILALNSSKAFEMLNWSPRWDFEKTMDITFQWYKNFYEGQEANQLIKKDIEFYLNISY
jgi:CDP-glucose 4,6-dehydratase